MLSKKYIGQNLILVCLVVLGVMYLLDDPRWKDRHPRTLIGTETVWHNDTVYVLKTTLESLHYEPLPKEIAAPDPR